MIKIEIEGMEDLEKFLSLLKFNHKVEQLLGELDKTSDELVDSINRSKEGEADNESSS